MLLGILVRTTSEIFKSNLKVALLIAVAATVGAQEPAQAKPSNNKKIETVPGQYVVQLVKERARFDQRALESRLGGRILSNVRPDMVVVQRNRDEDPMKVAKQLSALSEVRLAEPNYIFHALTTPNDPDYKKLWGLNNGGDTDAEGAKGVPGIDISAERAWQITTGSRNVVVAIIDTGLNYLHPDLAANAWTNELEANGKAGVDDDNNGYVDDIHGYNFADNNADPMDNNGHGSHCAGTIGGVGDNGIGVAGVNWKVSIMGVKFLDAGGSGSLDAAIKAVDYARKSNARVLSNSWGGNINSDLLKQAIGQTVDAGQLFVAAAGNESTDNDGGAGSYPASFPFENIVAVAAVNNRGEMASFSNYGSKSVHVAAPGVNIYSTSLKQGYESLSGTSMATPHVAGLAALLLSSEPSMTYKDLKQRLMYTARPLASLNGRVVSGGMIDAYYALTNQKAPPDPNDPSIWSNHMTTSASSPHPYVASFTQEFTVSVPGAKRLAVHFSKFETEAGYDKVQFINSKGEVVGAISGQQTGRYGPIVDGDSVKMIFTSDSSVQGYGFDVDFVASEN